MIVVTGGTGFIGSALIAGLNTRDITDILVVDELGSDAKWKNLRSLAFSDYFEKDDFLQMVLMDEVPDEVDVVLHMGACSDTTQTDASYLAINNYEYSKVLAEWAADRDIRLVYASSAATYGDGSLGFRDNEEGIAQLRPLNMYGYSKQMFDLWAYRNGLLGQIVGLKYFNVFGPNEYHKGNMRSFVIKAFEQIRDAGKVRLFRSHKAEYADGEQVRDFIYIKDAVEMTLFFLGRPDVSGLFNIGTGSARTWNDLVNAVFTALDAEPNIEYIDMPDSIRDQYQYFTQADMAKLREAGYDIEPISLEEAVKDYVQNYLVSGRYIGDV